MQEMRMYGSKKHPVWASIMAAGLALMIVAPWRLSSAEPPAPVEQLAASPLRLMPQLGIGHVTAIAISPDGRQVVMACDNTMAYLWDTATGQLLRTLTHRFHISSVAFSPDGRLVLIGGQVGEVFFWEAATGRLERTLQVHKGGVNSIAFSPDGQQILTGSRARPFSSANSIDNKVN